MTQCSKDPKENALRALANFAIITEYPDVNFVRGDNYANTVLNFIEKWRGASNAFWVAFKRHAASGRYGPDLLTWAKQTECAHRTAIVSGRI